MCGRVAHTINRASVIVGNQQRTIIQNEQIDWASVHVVVAIESCNEQLVAGRFVAIELHHRHSISIFYFAIPRPMLSDEHLILIPPRERSSSVELHPQGSDVSAKTLNGRRAVRAVA